MNNEVIYFLIALFASVIGSISGLGGGVIIKPMLDLTTNIGVGNIAVLSAFTVFFMSAAALIKQIFYKSKIQLKTGALLALGAVVGGAVGNILFEWVLSLISQQQYVTALQSFLLGSMLIFVIIYMNKFQHSKKYRIQAPLLIVVIGFGLGMISSFLGIGGGPVNILVLTLFFSMETKEAAVNSILLILFSQGAKIVSLASGGGLAAFDLSPLLIMIPVAVIGGIIGSKLNKSLSEKSILGVFNYTITFVIAVNLFNLIKILFWQTNP